MHRFYIPPDRWDLDALTLDEGEAHHALDVLRLQVGQHAVVFNGEGEEATVQIVAASKRSVQLEAVELRLTAPLPCQITLAQAIPKGKNMDLIVQKATELGAAAIVPLLSERTVVQADEKDATRKQQKWQQVVIEAAKQCGQNWLPKVFRPQSLTDFFAAGHPFDLSLVASLQPGALHPKQVIEHAIKQLDGQRPKSVLVLVGPEGDLTPAEIELALKHQCYPITLGPIVLRVETAALYCLSILNYELLT